MGPVSKLNDTTAGGVMDTNTEFDFGRTHQSEIFFDKNPAFYPVFERLLELSNKCFGREVPEAPLERVCFGLGHTCREDFLDIALLAVNGRGDGALKLLRSLYERAVTLAYLSKNPDKVDRFVQFAGVQEYKLLVESLKVVSEEEFDAACLNRPAAQIRENYSQIKSLFEISDCGRCNTKKTSHTWGDDFASMARKVGEPYNKCYLVACSLPNLRLHATLASTRVEEADDKAHSSEIALHMATVIILQVLKAQNSLFNLGIEAEINSIEEDANKNAAGAAKP
jgi:hypothetical protein